MNKRMIVLGNLFLALFLILFAAPSFAGVTATCLENHFESSGENAKLTLVPNDDGEFIGTALITMPDGDIVLADSQDQIPANIDGASVEIFDGKINLETSEKTMSLSCESEEGLAIIEKGPIRLLDPQQKEKVLESGTKYPILLLAFGNEDSGKRPEQTGADAPATEAGSPVGIPSTDGFRQPDSRNIQQS